MNEQVSVLYHKGRLKQITDDEGKIGAVIIFLSWCEIRDVASFESKEAAKTSCLQLSLELHLFIKSQLKLRNFLGGGS